MDNYASGTWARISKSKKNFVCCNSDHDLGSGGPQACQAGKKVQGFSYTYSGDGEPFKYIETGGHSCSCDAQPSTLDRVLDFEKYEWQPSVCQIKPFDAIRFCSMLNNRRILFVGDSTAQQAGSTLMNMIRAGNADGHGCSKDVQVRLTDTFGMWDDRSHDDQDHIWKSSDLDLEKPVFEFEDALRMSTKDDVVILSTGPHWDDEKKYRNMLISIAEKIQTRRGHIDPPVILWKTISGAGCSSPGIVNGEYWLDSDEAAFYSWNKFPLYDAMAAAAMQSMTPPVPIINVSMLYQRGDAHPGTFGKGDCLHFCTPGPLDVIAPILQHVLREVL